MAKGAGGVGIASFLMISALISTDAMAANQQACILHNTKTVEYCQDEDFSPEDQFLLAIAEGNLSRASSLRGYIKDIDFQSSTPVLISKLRVRSDIGYPYAAGAQRYQAASGTAFDIALSRNHVEVVRWLLRQGANPAAGYFKNIINRNHFTGTYPGSYLLLPYTERARIVAVGYALEQAASNNDVVAVKKLLSLEPRAIHYRGNTVLREALQLGKWEISDAILSQGHDVHELYLFDEMFKVPMNSKPMNYVLLQKLLQHAQQKKGFDFMPLVATAVNGNDEHALRLLKSAGADLNGKSDFSPLLQALDRKDARLAGILLGLGANPNNKIRGDESLLERAIRYENPEFVKLFIKHGAHVEDRDKTAKILRVAMTKTDPQYAQMIIAAGAAVNSKKSGDWQENTPLITATQQVRPQLMSLLLAAGAKPDLTNRAQQTALHIATEKSDLNMMDILIRAGADTNTRDSVGMTPLLKAIDKKNEKIVEKLIRGHADVNLKDSANNSPLLYAVRGQSLPMLRLLLQANAQPNTIGIDGTTALITALNLRRSDMARLLIQHGAGVNTVSNQRETPLDIAQKRGLLDIVQLIRQQGGRTALEMGARPEDIRVRTIADQ